MLGGCAIKKGEKLALWYPSSNRDESAYENADCFDVTRNPEHQASGPAADTSASEQRSPASSCGSSSARPCAASPR